MKHRAQRGMSSLSLLVVLSAAGFFLLVLFRVGPLYLDNYSVAAALESMGAEDVHQLSDDEGRRKLRNYFTINNIRDINVRDVAIERSAEGTVIKVDYEKRVDFLGNADVVVTFTNHLNSADYR